MVIDSEPATTCAKTKINIKSKFSEGGLQHSHVSNTRETSDDRVSVIHTFTTPTLSVISSTSNFSTVTPKQGSKTTNIAESTSIGKDTSNINEDPVFPSCIISTDTKPSKPVPQVKFTCPEAVPKPGAHSCDNELSNKKVMTTVASSTVVSSVPKTSEICTTSTVVSNPLKLNVKAAAHMPKENPSTTPQLHNGDPQAPTTEPPKKANCPKVGIDHLLKVKCNGSKQTYCFACSVRLEGGNHLTSRIHQINCVKKKFPWWSAKPSESKLSEMVTLLAEDQKALNICFKAIEVTFDVYKELKTLPEDKAIEKLQEIVKKKSSKKKLNRRPSKSDTSTSPCVSVSPYEAASPDLGQDHCQTKQKEESSALEKIPVSMKSAPCPAYPVENVASYVEATFIQGSTTENVSNLARFLTVKGMDKPIIGLCFVWECRIVSDNHRKTFYLCESCSQTILFREMFDHMANTEHKKKYLLRQYPKFMHWIDEDLPSEMADELINNIAGWVSHRESSMDAQVVLLNEMCFEWVRTAPFAKALEVVQTIRKEKKTTFLPLIATSQGEEEQRDQPSIQPTLDSSQTNITDLQNKTKTSMLIGAARKTDSADEKQETPSLDENAASLYVSHTSTTGYNKTRSPQIIELSLVSQTQSSASPDSPKQPEYTSFCSGIDLFSSKQKLSWSCRYEHQGQLQLASKACSIIHSPLGLESTVGSPSMSTAGTTTPVIQDANKNLALKTDIQLDSPLNWESSSSTTVISNTEQSDDSATRSVEEVEMPQKCTPQSSSDSSESTSINAVMASSLVGHNNTIENPSFKHDEAPMNLDYLKLLADLAKTTKLMRCMPNQTVNIVESCSIKSESNVQMCKAQKSKKWDVKQRPNTYTDAAPNVESMLTEDQSTPLIFTAEVPSKREDSLILSSDVSKMKPDKPASVNMTAVSSQQQTQENLTVGSVSKNINATHLTLETKSNTECPHLQNQPQSFQIPVLQTDVQIQNVRSNTYVPNSQDLMKVQLVSSEVQFAPTNSQLHQVQSSMEAVQQPDQPHSQTIQVVQGQVLQLQSQTQQTEDQMQQVSINSLITPRLDNIGYFNGEYNERHSQSVVNISAQVGQGLPTTNATTAPVTTCLKNTVVTGGYGQFFQTAYVTNENGYPNMNAQYFSHSSAYPGQFYHQLQTQQYYQVMQPFGQFVQTPEGFNSNTQSQSEAHTYSGWANGAASSVCGTSNVAYSNAAQFNTPNYQSYSNDYYRDLMQNQCLTQQSTPPNSQLFPNGQ